MNQNAKSKVAFFSHQPSGCFWYRIKRPMDALSKAGVHVEPVILNKDISDDIKTFQMYGAYPFSMRSILQYMKSEGKRIVYDTDDALDLIEPTNPFYYSVKRDSSSADEIMAVADEVTVSVPELAKYVAPKTKGKITVVPNCYTPEEWTYPRPDRGGLRIGFAGSATHITDLIPILPTIKKLQDKYDFTFVIMGFGKETYEKWYLDHRYAATDEGRKELVKFDKLLSEIKFEWVPFLDFEHYPATLTNIALDIGLCPLNDTPFNRCRSACKAMEYTLSGALALASDVEPYKTEPTSIRTNDWEKDLEYLINKPEVRKAEHAKHLAWLKENRDINTKIDLLKSIYVV